MLPSPLVSLLAAVLFGVNGPAQAAALTLADYYAAALQRSEVVATQTELLRQAEERYNQATAALRPNVSGAATYLWQEPLPSGTPTSPTTQSRQHVTRLTASQPIFRGFRELAAVRQSEALRGAQTDDAEQARLLLYRDVVQNFYSVLSLEKDLENLAEQIRLNREREKDIEARVRIGRSRVSEVLNVQTTINTLRAQVEQQRGQLQVARAAFAFLSGLDADTALRDAEPAPPPPTALADYLAGVGERPDVRAGKKRIAAADENVGVARGGHLPSLDLNGNYYFDRPGYLGDSNWDVQLALTIPIYAGGATQSKVREALSQKTQAELTLSQVTRQAEQEVRALYESWRGNLAQLEALERATETAKKSYDAQSAEYRLGLVINLDVLQALTAYQENQRALDRARLTVKSDYLRLLAAAGRNTPAP
jgi:outer membrane protein